jgi:hypothetical protein
MLSPNSLNQSYGQAGDHESRETPTNLRRDALNHSTFRGKVEQRRFANDEGGNTLAAIFWACPPQVDISAHEREKHDVFPITPSFRIFVRGLRPLCAICAPVSGSGTVNPIVARPDPAASETSD